MIGKDKNTPESTVLDELKRWGPLLPPDTVLIPLTNGMAALINKADYKMVSQYEWYANLFKCSYYACTNVIAKKHRRTLRMHRLIARTPPRKITHHKNHNSLDNRRSNLINLTPREHTDLHCNNRILIKYAKNA